tara:strand:- start:2017 stop:2298 length:282 start_codon:yes stop_codon:yes gene_type:complete
MSEKEFINGLIVKAPRENAPDFVKGSLSIKREELIEWLQGKDGDWVNVQMKESKGGKWYAEVDNWKPDTKHDKSKADGYAPQKPEFDDNSIPF